MPKDDFRELLIREVQTVADRVVAVRLGDLDGSRLPAWQAGSHVPVQLPSGLVRQYSLCGALDRPDEWTIAVLCEDNGRGGSREFHEVARPGRRLLVGPPRNNFELLPDKEYVFVAGGIGITPILAMCRAAASQGVPWTLFYGGRSIDSMAFVDVLSTLPGGTIRLLPEDKFGLLDLSKIVERATSLGQLYCCGPEGLLDGLNTVASCTGVELRMERFRPLEDAVDRANAPFRVRVQGHDEALDVTEDQTILEVLRKAGFDPLYSCEEGTCGTCETRVLAGTPDHRDSVLSEADRAAGDRMMICVSRSCSPELTLEVDS